MLKSFEKLTNGKHGMREVQRTDHGFHVAGREIPDPGKEGCIP